jgi:hypothetical protein
MRPRITINRHLNFRWGDGLVAQAHHVALDPLRPVPTRIACHDIPVDTPSGDMIHVRGSNDRLVMEPTVDRGIKT